MLVGIELEEEQRIEQSHTDKGFACLKQCLHPSVLPGRSITELSEQAMTQKERWRRHDVMWKGGRSEHRLGLKREGQEGWNVGRSN